MGVGENLFTDMQPELLIFQLAVLIFSIMIHEISHGAVAFYLGDDTAKKAGRLTLNPLKHLDPFGSIILPAILAIPLLFGARSIIVGWAKPVPYDPRNLKNPKMGAGLIALAGPVSNLIIAVVFALLLRLATGWGNPALILAFQVIILLNLVLAIFNLFPIPPLDGSKILYWLLPEKQQGIVYFLERNALILILALIIFGLPLLHVILAVVYSALLRLVGL